MQLIILVEMMQNRQLQLLLMFLLINIVTIPDQPSIPPILIFQIMSNRKRTNRWEIE